MDGTFEELGFLIISISINGNLSIYFNKKGNVNGKQN